MGGRCIFSCVEIYAWHVELMLASCVSTVRSCKKPRSSLPCLLQMIVFDAIRLFSVMNGGVLFELGLHNLEVFKCISTDEYLVILNMA